jgi:hypothetical protein
MLIELKNTRIRFKTDKITRITQNSLDVIIPNKAIFHTEENRIVIADWFLKITKLEFEYNTIKLDSLIDKTRKPLKELLNEKSSDYFPEKAMEHQKKCFKWAVDKKCVALFNDMGTGKSKLYIDIANYHYSCGNINRVIYYAPITTLDNFKNEIKLWQKSNLLWEVRSINSLSVRLGEKFNQIVDEIKDTDMVIIDESHRIKDIHSLMSNTAWHIGMKTNFKIIGTGTSAPNYAIDLVGQFRFLTPQEYNMSSNQLKKTYLTISEKGIVDKKSKNDLEILNKSFAYTYSIKKEDCLDLPTQIYRNILVDDDKLLEFYRQKAREESTLFLSSSGGLMGFLQNLRKYASGRDVDGNVVIKNPKILYLKELIQDLPKDKKIIIWHTLYNELTDILQVIDSDYTILNGSQNEFEKAKSIDEFKNNQNIRFLISTSAVGGVGLNFTEASINIYFSNDFDLINRLQSSSRIHRIGQNNQCIYYDIIMKNTIEIKIKNSIDKKESFMGELIKLYKNKGGLAVVEKILG